MRPIHALMVEDNPADAQLIVAQLRRSGFDPEWLRVDNKVDYVAHLNPHLDIILCDYNMPHFNGLHALRLLRERRLNIPFIIVTGALGDELAAECIKEGADDYLLKDRLGRLGTAVEEALELRKLRSDVAQNDAALVHMNTMLEQHMRELAALNSLFKTHLQERFEIIQAVRYMIAQFSEASPGPNIFLGAELEASMGRVRSLLPSRIDAIPVSLARIG